MCWTWDKKAYYTIVMFDPDLPSREDPEDGQFIHWIVANMKGPDPKTGDTFVEYIGALPGKDTDFHRYIFLIYKQGGQICFKEKKLSNKTAEWRYKWNLNDFVGRNGLGAPYAGNFFFAEFDCYVAMKRREIGMC